MLIRRHVLEVIEFYTQKTASCWWWKGELDRGKAKLIIKRKTLYPAPIMWEYYNEEKVPEGFIVKLSCENKTCVNPKHTYISRKTFPWLQ